MDSYKTFVTDSISEYDKNMKEQNKLLKNAEYFEFLNSNDSTENDKIFFYDNDGIKILEADYEVIGTYNALYALWTWAWGNPAFDKKWTRIITKILNYGFSLDPKKNYHLKLELVNSRFIISDNIQIDIHLAIASALSKIKNIYNLVISSDEKKIVKDENNRKRQKIFKNLEDNNVQIHYLFLFNIKSNKIEK
jgi:hypothetical protein